MIDDLLAQIKQEFDKRENTFDQGVLSVYQTLLCFFKHKFEEKFENSDTKIVNIEGELKGILDCIQYLEDGSYPVINKWKEEARNK